LARFVRVGDHLPRYSIRQPKASTLVPGQLESPFSKGLQVATAYSAMCTNSYVREIPPVAQIDHMLTGRVENHSRLTRGEHLIVIGFVYLCSG
jgi:hypothetical protein